MERLPSGRTEIAGTDCFINVMETVTKEETQADFEVHRKYMDIQIDLEGMEAVSYTHLDKRIGTSLPG